MEYQQRLNGKVRALHASGKNYTQIVIAIAVTYGYSLPIAHRIVDAALCQPENDGLLRHRAAEEGADFPDIAVGADNALDLGDTRATVVFEQLAPRIVLVDGFMSPEECELMCEIAEPRMRTARVMSKTTLSGNLLTSVRDANTAFVHEESHPLVGTIERRIATMTGWAGARGETLQVQRYRQDGKYVPHYDFFSNKSVSETHALSVAGQRLATLIVYLRAPRSGGATYMANLGIKIAPRRGAALFFSYPDASERSGTLHGGDPVREGEKWILTKWFRQRHRALTTSDAHPVAEEA
jgi:prolyl 4-hydroxylase